MSWARWWILASVLLGAVSGCGGPGPEPLLDWSLPVAPSPAPALLLPRLRVEGPALLREDDGREVRLRGVNVCSLEFDAAGTRWELGEEGSALLETLSDAARWNVNAVRIPVNQQWFLEDEDYVGRLERLLDHANSLGVYVLVDVQWEVGRKLDPYHLNILEVPTFGEGNTTEAFWHKATSRWANRTNLLLDLINEPHGQPEEEIALSMQALVDGIRQRTTDAVIVVGGPNWAHSVDYYRKRPLFGPNLVYSAHQYLPEDSPERFEDNFGAASDAFPVLLGEFLAEESNAAYATGLVAFAEERGVDGWFPWAIGCGFDKDADLAREPLRSLARTMRELNP